MNIAYVDGQNLYMGTSKIENNPWTVDLSRFRKYLQEKYNVSKAYYFLGFVQEHREELYEHIQSAGFILMFREHNSSMIGKKKGNVDTDIVFSIMKRLYRGEGFEQIVLVSGDGDYKMLVDFLIDEKKLRKILFPNKTFASSLYNSLGSQHFDNLDNPDIKRKIGVKKERGSLGN